MIEHFDAIRFRKQLISWYKKHKRNLPWRDTTDFYKIWISEIILQQTQVAQGHDYYLRFLKQFPNVNVLASASEQEVLNAWQGLGYYTRAINLHKAAKQIISDFNGEFPVTYDEILSLKGVGSYTAAAIASFTYRLPYAVVDGNVLRVLSRLFDDKTPINSAFGKKHFEHLATELLDHTQPDVYNQAIMEFGALQCRPQNPDCKQCVLINQCEAYRNKTVGERPKKETKKTSTVRYFTYFVIKTPQGYVLQQRDSRSIFKNMYEFPLVETMKKISKEKTIALFEKNYPTLKNINISTISRYQKHVLSHIIIYYRYAFVEQNVLPKDEMFSIVSKKMSAHYPLHRIIEKILEKLD